MSNNNNNSNMTSYANSLNNHYNPNINAQQQFMSQNSRFHLPPNIQQQINNKQNNNSPVRMNPVVISSGDPMN